MAHIDINFIGNFLLFLQYSKKIKIIQSFCQTFKCVYANGSRVTTKLNKKSQYLERSKYNYCLTIEKKKRKENE